jgi:hypothetical protein
MPLFYPCTLLDTTATVSSTVTVTATPSNLLPSISTSAVAAQSSPTPTRITNYSQGISLSPASIIGIIAAVLFLFGGLAWFAYHAHVTIPKRKKEAMRKRRERDLRRVWEGRV